MDYETLGYEKDDHVVTLVYDRPDQHNAINTTMAGELHHAWRRFRDDDDAFVLIIIGAGAFKRGERPEWPPTGSEGEGVLAACV